MGGTNYVRLPDNLLAVGPDQATSTVEMWVSASIANPFWNGNSPWWPLNMFFGSLDANNRGYGFAAAYYGPMWGFFIGSTWVSAGEPNGGLWTHLALVRNDAGVVSMFVNGVLAGTTTTNVPAGPIGSSGLLLGNVPQTINSGLGNFVIAGVRFWTVDRSASITPQSFGAPVDPTTGGLALYLRFASAEAMLTDSSNSNGV